MKNFSVKNFALILIAGTVAFLAFKLWMPKTYLVRAEAILIRYNSEVSGDNSELAKNRWIWVRDGLEVSTRLHSVDLARRILSDLSLDTTDADDLAHGQLKIDYTGGDENLYIFELTYPDQEAGVKIVQAYLNELEKLGRTKVPANERTKVREAQTEVITPPTLVGDLFSLKQKTLVFALVILSLAAGLLPLAWGNLRRSPYVSAT